MTYVGHEHIWERLSTQVYPVVLLHGPESVGKRTMVLQLLAERQVPALSRLFIPQLTVPQARFVLDYTTHMASTRYIIIQLDNASAEAQNMLLKLLEEPPLDARFILISSEHTVLPTIASRAQVFVFGLLTDEQVRDVLVLSGMEPEAASRQARAGGGRVRPAMEAAAPTARSKVIAALRVVTSGNPAQLETALRDWDAEAHELLGIWTAEAAIPRWRRFDESAAPQLTTQDARKLMGALAHHPLANPRLAAATSLAQLMRGR